jgi:hypothetical protein
MQKGKDLDPKREREENLTLSVAPNSSWAIERALERFRDWHEWFSQFQDTNSPRPAGFYRALLQ